MAPAEIRRLVRFIVIGASAAAIHYITVLALVEGLAAAPLLANVGGFAVAFWCSFFGHRYWTFGDHDVSSEGGSLLRFFATSALGFALNELLFWLFLRVAGLRYEIALAIAMVLVAISTYLLSRLWAFRHHPAGQQP